MQSSREFARIWINTLDRLEISLRAKAARNRNTYLSEAAQAYEGAGSVPQWVTERHVRRINATLAAHYEVVGPHFAAMTRRQIKSRTIEKKSLFVSLMAEWIAREALRKARIISATDTDDIRDAIDDGIAEGLGAAEIARNIRKVSALTPHRASVIARTETHAAATYGSITSVRQAEQELGIRMLKQWLPTTDDRTRDAHAEMAGSEPIPMDEKFIVGGELMDRPGDPSASPGNVISCRCALIYSQSTY